MIEEKLVTKSLLKEFGDKCKKLFCPVSANMADATNIFIISTNIPYNQQWNISCYITGLEGNKVFEILTEVNNEEVNAVGQMINNSLSAVNNAMLYEKDGVLALAVEMSNEIQQIKASMIELNQACTNCITSITFESTYPSPTRYIPFGTDPYGVLPALDLIRHQDLQGFKVIESDFSFKTYPEYTEFDTIKYASYTEKLKEPIQVNFSGQGLKSSSVQFDGSNYIDLVSGVELVAEDYSGEVIKNFRIVDGRIIDINKASDSVPDEEMEIPIASTTEFGIVKLGASRDVFKKIYPVQMDLNGRLYVQLTDPTPANPGETTGGGIGEEGNDSGDQRPNPGTEGGIEMPPSTGDNGGIPGNKDDQTNLKDPDAP